MIRSKAIPSLLPDIPHPAIFAHRGGASMVPENTMAAFRKCLEIGVHGIEFDIHRCASGELVVIHDHGLDRLAGVSGVVEELPYAELNRLDVGSHFSPSYAGEHIPLLDELLETCGDKLFYDIEIKSEHRKDSTGISAHLVQTIRQHNLTGCCLVSSFNPFRIREVRKAAPELTTSVIYSSDENVPKLLQKGFGRYIAGCNALKPHYALVTEDMMKKHSRYPVLPWTVNSREEAERLFSLGCTGIITDRPQDFTEYFTN